MNIKWNEIDLSLVTTRFPCIFVAEDIQLIYLWKDRIAELMADESLCKTPRQKHFFEVLTGKLTAETSFEKLWLKVICIHADSSKIINMENQIADFGIKNRNLSEKTSLLSHLLRDAQESERREKDKYLLLEGETFELVKKVIDLSNLLTQNNCKYSPFNFNKSLIKEYLFENINKLSNSECEFLIGNWLTELNLHQVSLLYNKNIELEFSKSSSDAIRERYQLLNKVGGYDSFIVYSTDGQ